MANQGIMHLATKQGGKPYCNSRLAIMSTTPDLISKDGWERVCKKCDAVRLRYEKKVQVKTIDLTPTWAGILPLLIAGLVDGSETAKSAARAELTRMAGFADKYVEAQKRSPAETPDEDA